MLSKEELRNCVVSRYPHLNFSIKKTQIIHKPIVDFSMIKTQSNRYNFKGESVSYSGLHKWVRSKLGNPTNCSHCNTCRVTGKRSNIQWANISHKYRRELDDWIALCVKCHKNYDYNNYKII